MNAPSPTQAPTPIPIPIRTTAPWLFETCPVCGSDTSLYFEEWGNTDEDTDDYCPQCDVEEND